MNCGTRTICGCGQLPTSSEAVGHETLEEDRFEICPGQVDGSGMSCRSRTDNNLKRNGIKWAGRSNRGSSR